ncbi:hypothetical protein MRB53_037732 [Persea americana]|nr:hypothetical protein MRB53_037732 [Persea americana]
MDRRRYKLRILIMIKNEAMGLVGPPSITPAKWTCFLLGTRNVVRRSYSFHLSGLVSSLRTLGRQMLCTADRFPGPGVREWKCGNLPACRGGLGVAQGA